MSVKQPSELAEYLKAKKNVLLLTGELCDKVDWDGKSLLDYAADIAKKLNLPVAATANTAKGLKARAVQGAAKKYAAEIVDFMRWPEWRDKIMPEKPEVLVFIGYHRAASSGFISMVGKNAETVSLNHIYEEEATYSLPDTAASLRQYQQNLEKLIQAL
ncbi:MAG: carbon monoxide dehydrogenase beta subunit family protein [Syntrophales bacterium]